MIAKASVLGCAFDRPTTPRAVSVSSLKADKAIGGAQADGPRSDHRAFDDRFVRDDPVIGKR